MYYETKKKQISMPPVPPKPLPNTYRKHVGYYCSKCETEKRLNVMRLCPCLDLVEDVKAVRKHINTYWSSIYADMDLPPPTPRASVR